MSNRDIVVIGASAGGIEALETIFKELPGNLDASIFVVCHIGEGSTGIIPHMITKKSKLKAINARNKDRIAKKTIYVAPPDYHLMLEEGFTRIVKGPKENRFRPAIDPLFRSAAHYSAVLSV